MLDKLFDDRLAAVIPEQQHLLLKTRAEQAYQRLQREAPADLLADLAELVLVMREVETKLLDDRLGNYDTDWAQGTMATLA
jgi:hypothetical protein